MQEKQETNTKPDKRTSHGWLFADAFIAGFATTVGMMAAASVYQNRRVIRAYVRDTLIALGQSM